MTSFEIILLWLLFISSICNIVLYVDYKTEKEENKAIRENAWNLFFPKW